MNKGIPEHAQSICLFTSGFSLILLFASLGSAQTAPPITSSGLNTQISAPSTLPSGKVQYDITAGTRPGGGANLFHSFGDFNVPNNNIANFLNDTPNVPTSNILGRVTGGNLSSILGTIQTTGFGNANLFLMNPAGFLFGPNATVNVGGMVTFTSADYLRLGDNARFNAVPGPADGLLSAAPVAAFGFLGSHPGAITVQGSQLTVTEGSGVSLVGGNITIQNGTLESGTIQSARVSASGGQIQLTSLASAGEVLVASSDSAPPGGVFSLPTSGSITISQGSMLDVSGQTAGKISIRSGHLELDNATLQSNTVLGNSGNIQIVSSAMSMKSGLIQTSTAGGGAAGDIAVDTRTLNMSDGAFINSIALPGPGLGQGGNIRVNATESISILGFRPGNAFLGPIPVTNYPTSLNTPTFSLGRGGSIEVTTPQLELRGGALQTQTFGPGRAGNIVTTVGRLYVTEGASLSSTSFGAGDGGNVTVNATDSVHVLGLNPGTVIQAGVAFVNNPSAINSNARGPGNGGQITITTPVLEMQTGVIVAQTSATGRGGTISVDVDELSLTKGAVIQSNTIGSGPGGTVTVNATETISISGRSGVTYSIGPQVFQNIPSRIATSTVGAGPAGHITLSAANLIISDQGGISVATAGPAPSATGGNITINADQVQVNSGGFITASTTGAGVGGSINLNASNTFTSDAGTVSSTALQAAGGNINITAGQSVTLTNGATVSASSKGAGNAGNVQINAGNQLTMTNSSITTEASQSSGGAIKITTNSNGTVELTNSMISASVLDGNGGGGSVNIDPEFVILQNSQILANAVFGPGGNINIATNLLLPDSTSIISASSAFGQQGTITIQSPISPASGKIVPLGQKPLLATSLLSQRCAALAGGSISSFTVAGRETVPAEPTSWLASPLALSMAESQDETIKEADSATSEDASPLSLRNVAPSGFLTQAFATESSGCKS